jgi:hypothetical protein
MQQKRCINSGWAGAAKSPQPTWHPPGSWPSWREDNSVHVIASFQGLRAMPCNACNALQCVQCLAMQSGLGGCNDATMQCTVGCNVEGNSWG